MIKNICIYITLLTLFLLNVSETLAIKIDPYLVTEGKEFVGNPHLNRTYFYKNMPINYQSGKVVLSFNPDGTGDTVIGEELFVNVGDNTFTFKTSSAACNGIGNTTMKPLDITHLLNKGLNNLRVTYRKVWCNKQQISQMYLVHFNDYEPTAAPFLDLPWDYTSKGLSFVEAATKITAYFDHEYPLLSADWIVQEPIDVNSDLVDFTGVKGNKPYSKHDGYDYAAISEAFLNDPVLSAAPGIASFHNNCSACGNAIYIDHQNGYQTRYYHLQPDGLITNNPNQKITVINRQQIGKIGSTGRSTGAHIHFMLIQDKNGDGNFDDNIPDGIVDPYGWQGNGADPWPQFTFTQNDETKTGTKSNYLWRNSMQHITKTLPTTGGNYTHDRFNFIFPNGTTTKDLIFSLKPAPYAEPSAVLQPVS